MNDVSLQLLAPDVLIWALVLIPALCLAFWAYYRILAPLSLPSRTLLWMLRALAFAIVVFALWQPTLSYRVPDTGRPRLAVLVDRSGSMALPASESRFADRGAEADARLTDLLRELGDRYALDRYDFGARLQPAQEDSVPSLGSTSIGGALEEVLVRSAAQPLHGIVLVSDGVNTQGRDPVRVARGVPVPVFALPVGAETAPSDLEIRKVRTNPRAFAGEPLPVEVVVSSHGLAGETGRVELRADGELVAEEEIEILGDRGLEQSIRFEVKPQRPGWARYEVRAQVGGDAVSQNDVREIAVEVMERKTRVLCVADALEWDFAFLRKVFEADTTLGYSYLVRTDGNAYRGFGENPPQSLPDNGSELADYAAVVLVSSGRAALPQSFLATLGEFVARGGGLWIVGGPARAGEWSQVDALSRVLPANVLDGGGPALPPAPVELTIHGMRHPITALRENASESGALFAALPPVWRSAHLLEPKGNGRELLAFRGDGPGRALLVAGYGDRGKVVWFHGRGIWRWQLSAAATDLPPQLFTDFAIGTVRWLAEPAIRERFQVEPGRRVYPNGESVSFLANLWDAALQPIGDARVEVEIVSGDSAATTRDGNAAPSDPADPDGEVSDPRLAAPLTLEAGAEPGTYEGTGPSLAPGAYRYRARALDDQGGELGRAAGVFWVESMGPEFARIVSDPETMRQIAEESRGRVVAPVSLAGLADEIPKAIQRLGRVREVEVWNHWALFVLFVLVLSTEWFLRRRRGLA